MNVIIRETYSIRGAREYIEDRRTYWVDRLGQLQAACPHENVKKTPRADTGNYDPSSDRYWHDCKCPDCGKFWTEDKK